MIGARCRDMLVAGLVLPLCIPLGLACALLVRLVDGGPIFFVQERSGLAGRPFRLRKFRTMTVATGDDGQLLPDRQRTTTLGRFLRRSRLDELPQIWSVLVGDMSLVGPRPLLPPTVAQAGDRGRLRGRVRPGLTGWAQVNGNSLLDDDAKMALDGWYVEHQGHGLDCRIIARTLLVLLRGETVNNSAIGRAHACSPDRCG